MKYVAYVYEEGYGCIFKRPENFLGIKTIIEEVFDTLQEANKAACETVKDLYDKYDLCKIWLIKDSALCEKCIETLPEDIDGWTHFYRAEVYSLTDEEYKEWSEEN